MNKNELVAKMAEKAGLKKTEAEKALKGFHRDSSRRVKEW